jgi:rhodanese-related sulfurtransferase
MEADALKAALDRGDRILVVDVREPGEFDGPLGHIAGARNIPLASLDGQLDDLRAARDRPITLVCKTDRRSAAAAEQLVAAGFPNVSVLRQGMERWDRLGFPKAAP